MAVTILGHSLAGLGSIVGTKQANERILGMLLELLGTTLSIIGLNGQKYAQLSLKFGEGPADKKKLKFRFQFCLALIVLFLGQGIEGASQAYISQSLVSSLSNSALVMNVLIARFVFDEPFRIRPKYSGWRVLVQWDLAAVIMILIGTVMAVMSAPALPEKDFSVVDLEELMLSSGYMYYFGLCVVVVIVCVTWLLALPPPAEQTSNTGGLLFAVLAATNGSFVVTLAKICALLVKSTANGDNQFEEIDSYFFCAGLVVTAVSNLFALNQGLAHFESLVVLPVYYVLNSFTSIVAGLILYGTFTEMTKTEVLVFCTATFINFSGVYIVSCRPHNEDAAVSRWKTARHSLQRSLSMESFPVTTDDDDLSSSPLLDSQKYTPPQLRSCNDDYPADFNPFISGDGEADLR